MLFFIFFLFKFYYIAT